MTIVTAIRGMTKVFLVAILLCLACSAQDQQWCRTSSETEGIRRLCVPSADCPNSPNCTIAQIKALTRQNNKPKYSCPSSYVPSVNNLAIWVELGDGLYCISAARACEHSIGNCFDVATRVVERGIQAHSCQPSHFTTEASCSPLSSPERLPSQSSHH